MARLGLKKKLIIVLILFILLACPVSAWYQGYNYRKNITINGSDTPLSYYVVNFTLSNLTSYSVDVNCSNNSLNFPEDIRFTDVNDLPLSYWMNNTTDFEPLMVWVNVTSFAAYPTDTYIYMYYGNASAVNVSDGASTFHMFDDFNRADNAAVGGGWTEDAANIGSIEDDTLRLDGHAAAARGVFRAYSMSPEDFVVQAEYKILSIAGAGYWYHIYDNTDTDIYAFRFNGVTGNLEYAHGGGWAAWAAYAADRWYTFRMYYDDGAQTVIYWIDGCVDSCNLKTGVPVGGGAANEVSFGTSGNGAHVARVDNVFARNYTEPEPMFEFLGGEELHTEFNDRLPVDSATDQDLNTTLQVRYVNFADDTTYNITFWDFNNSNETIIATNMNIMNNTTTTTPWSNLSYGVEYCWFVQANNTSVGVSENSSTFCFITVGGITVYEENNPTTVIISDTTVVYNNQTTIWERDTESGILNTTNVPTHEEILLTFQANADYYARNILLPNGLFEVTRLYLLSQTADAVTVTFTIADYTNGDFSGYDTRIILRRWISGAERYICGGYRGVGNSFGCILQLGATYNVYVANDVETRSLGIYYAQQSGTVTLTVGYVTYPYEVTTPGEWVLTNFSKGLTYYANDTLSDAWVLITYNDTYNLTSYANMSILNATDNSIIYSSNNTIGTAFVAFTYHFNLSNWTDSRLSASQFLITINFSSSGIVEERYYLFDFGFVVPLAAEFADEVFGIKPGYAQMFALVILVFATMIFSYAWSDIGAFFVCFLGAIMWQMGMIPNLGLGVIILVFIIAVLNALYVKKKKEEI